MEAINGKMLPAVVIHILKDQSTLISPQTTPEQVLLDGGATAEHAGAPESVNWL